MVIGSVFVDLFMACFGLWYKQNMNNFFFYKFKYTPQKPISTKSKKCKTSRKEVKTKNHKRKSQKLKELKK